MKFESLLHFFHDVGVSDETTHSHIAHSQDRENMQQTYLNSNVCSVIYTYTSAYYNLIKCTAQF